MGWTLVLSCQDLADEIIQEKEEQNARPGHGILADVGSG
jgi:hypothetical protein